jgi:hypothetical protein
MSRHRPRRARAAAFAAAVLALAGCATGERPTLASGPGTSGDAAVDAVLQQLDQARAATFTARYDILTRFGGRTRPATVVQVGPARRSITVGRVRFIIDTAETATCNLDDGTCSRTIDAARISDTQLAPDFFATSAAVRLRRAAAARVGPTTASTATIAGQPATCVGVPVTGATETYCTLAGGPLARLDAADVKIDLTGWSATPDQAQFAHP